MSKGVSIIPVLLVLMIFFLAGLVYQQTTGTELLGAEISSKRPSKPDFVVVGASCSPSALYDLICYVDVRNDGGKATRVTFTNFLTISEIGSNNKESTFFAESTVTETTILEGGFVGVDYGFLNFPPGEYTAKVSIDLGDSVKESDEKNNYAKFTFTISGEPSCAYGFARPTSSVNFGGYRLYSYIGSNDDWANVVIKDRYDNTTDTLVGITEGNSKDSVVTGLRVKVFNVLSDDLSNVVYTELSVCEIS